MATSGYVLAGFETLAFVIDRFKKHKEFDENFTTETLNNFFGSRCNKFLHSFGQYLQNKKKTNKYQQSELDLLNTCRGFGYFENSQFLLDSGGYQISAGILNKKESETLIRLYYDFLEKYTNCFDKAFILDITPGPGCQYFENFNQVYDVNMKMYNQARLFPKELRDKMIYIHHCRTPKLWDTYINILDHEDMFSAFNYHATGGIVSNMKSDLDIPCIIYVLSLVTLLNRAIKYGKKELNFHILGGSTYRDILFYELFKKVVREKHAIELTITYDSSGIFKGLMIGRFMYLFEDEIIRKTNLRSSHLEQRFFRSSAKTIDVVRGQLDKFCDQFGFKRLTRSNFYDPDTGTFHEDVRLYLMLYTLGFYSDVEELMKSKVDSLYEMFDNKQYGEFNVVVNGITQNINSGKITSKQTSKSNSLIKSLEMLVDLDEDYCRYIVQKFLAKDEFTELMGNKVLTF